MESQIDEIKNKLDVVEVIGNYIKLVKTGANYRGVCPFHAEKTPSFFVSPSRQMWKCFGCGAGHSIFDFIMKIEGIEFGDALRLLAKKAGVELKRENPKLQTERQRLYEICELSCIFFEKQLKGSSIGKEAKEYLLKRGISEESIKKWRLGYSPDTWEGLSDFLIGQGYKRDEIVKSGLAVAKPARNNAEALGGDSYDRFRGRIIFPIFDLNSNPVGFGGRIFKEAGRSGLQAEGGAKYINTPQTLLYDKSNLLYGLNFAKLPARKNGQIILTEGYTDTIMSHQAGFENTVATSGTALTQQHLNILKRYSDNLILAFDMDSAGQNATRRGIDLAQEKGFNIKIIENYVAKDPADIILEDAKKWKEVLDKAKSIMDYYFDSAFLKFDKTIPEGKKEIAKIILPAIKRISNKIEQAHWISKLAGKLQVAENIILEELEKTKLIQNYSNIPQNYGIASNNSKENNDSFGRKKMLEEKILALLAKNPENIDLIEDCHKCLFCLQSNQFIETFKNNKNPQAVFADMGKITGDPQEKKNFLDTIALKQEIQDLENLQEADREEILLCLSHLKDIDLKTKREQLSHAIKLAEQEGNLQKAQELIQQFCKLSQER